MASRSTDVGTIVRLALPTGDPRRGAGPGLLARGTSELARRTGTGLAHRTGGTPPAGVPEDAWSSPDATDTRRAALMENPIVRANPALAAYAASLAAGRGRVEQPPRGLPLAARRRGGGRGPGGLAAELAPRDRAPDPDVAAALRSGRAPATGGRG